MGFACRFLAAFQLHSQADGCFFLEGRFPLLGCVCSLHPAVGGTFWIAASDVLVPTLDSLFPDHYFSGWTQVEQDCTGYNSKWLFKYSVSSLLSNLAFFTDIFLLTVNVLIRSGYLDGVKVELGK